MKKEDANVQRNSIVIELTRKQNTKLLMGPINLSETRPMIIRPAADDRLYIDNRVAPVCNDNPTLSWANF